MQQREGGQQMRDIALATRIYFAADADRRKTTRSTAAPPLYRPRGIYPIDINSPGNRPNRVGVTERTGARERSREIRIRRK